LVAVGEGILAGCGCKKYRESSSFFLLLRQSANPAGALQKLVANSRLTTLVFDNHGLGFHADQKKRTSEQGFDIYSSQCAEKISARFTSSSNQESRAKKISKK
jgi:hypothetical protein